MAKEAKARRFPGFARKLAAYMERAGVDQSKLARELRIKPQSVQQWLNGENMPRGERNEALRRLLDVSQDELFSDPEAVLENFRPGPPLSSLTVREERARHVGRQRVPRISWIQAGHGIDVTDPYAMGEGHQYDYPEVPMGPNSYSLIIEGDSMEPDFPDGCIIFVDPGKSAVNRDFVIVRFESTQTATFKQLVIDGDKRYLRPLNSRYPIIPLGEDARVCGVVREMQLRRTFR